MPFTPVYVIRSLLLMTPSWNSCADDLAAAIDLHQARLHEPIDVRD